MSALAHLGLRDERGRLPLHADLVPSRGEPQLDLPSVGLVELHDQLLRGGAHEDAAGQLVAQDQRGRGAQVGHHHVAGPGELDVVGGVLDPVRGLGGPPQGLAVGELVGLVQRHPALPGRAAAPRIPEIRKWVK